MKKIFLILGILLFAFKAEAATYYAINTGTLTWSSAASWNTASNQAVGNAGAAPTSADSCFLDAFSSNITVSATSACGAIDATGYTHTWTFNANQTLTASGNVTFPSGVGGTIAGTGVLQISGSRTLTSNGITFTGTFSLPTNATLTLSGNLTMNVFNVPSQCSVSAVVGAYSVTTATLTYNNPTNCTQMNFPAGQTLTVTTALNMLSINGTYQLSSGTSSTKTFLNYTGSSANCRVGATFTDVTASGLTLYNFYGGTLTRTSNIYNVTTANIGGIFIQ